MRCGQPLGWMGRLDEEMSVVIIAAFLGSNTGGRRKPKPLGQPGAAGCGACTVHFAPFLSDARSANAMAGRFKAVSGSNRPRSPHLTLCSQVTPAVAWRHYITLPAHLSHAFSTRLHTQAGLCRQSLAASITNNNHSPPGMPSPQPRRRQAGRNAVTRACAKTGGGVNHWDLLLIVRATGGLVYEVAIDGSTRRAAPVLRRMLRQLACGYSTTEPSFGENPDCGASSVRATRRPGALLALISAASPRPSLRRSLTRSLVGDSGSVPDGGFGFGP